ncbi:MAG TPA: hypothetical protein VI248_22570 [Kineosporiaceae bacterium]
MPAPATLRGANALPSAPTLWRFLAGADLGRVAAAIEAHHRRRGGIPEDTIRAQKNDYGALKKTNECERAAQPPQGHCVVVNGLVSSAIAWSECLL